LVSYDIFKKLGTEIGELVASKQVQYGDSAGRAGQILAVLYPSGVPVHAYDDALLIVRCLDKFSRIAQRGEDGKDLGGESPWKDIAGYGLLGWKKDDCRESEELPPEIRSEIEAGVCIECGAASKRYSPYCRDCSLKHPPGHVVRVQLKQSK